MRGILTVTLLAMGLLSAVGEARERELGAPVYDSEAETTHRQVSWRDFKGEGTKPPGWSRWEKGSFAQARGDLDQRIRERFEQGVEELMALQRRYDGDTRNGSHKKQQKTWAARIEERMREATDALAELLGDG